MNQNKSDREYAAYLARQFFKGKISEYNIMDSYPNFQKDPKIKLLYNRIMQKPRKSWFFGLSKQQYEKWIVETYEIIEDLETDKLRFKTMKSLLQQLWLQSNNCKKPIKNMGFNIFEVSKMTYDSINEIERYLNSLIEKKLIKKISNEPILYEFTLIGMKIKTDSDIEILLKSIN